MKKKHNDSDSEGSDSEKADKVKQLEEKCKKLEAHELINEFLVTAIYCNENNFVKQSGDTIPQSAVDITTALLDSGDLDSDNSFVLSVINAIELKTKCSCKDLSMLTFWLATVTAAAHLLCDKSQLKDNPKKKKELRF